MILDLIILAILVLSFTAGFRRGFVAEFLNFVGFIFALALAWRYTTPLTDWVVHQFNFVEYERIIHWVTFLILYTIVWRVVMLLKRVINPATRIIGLKQINAIFGGAIRFLIAYLFVFAGLNLLIAISNPVREQYEDATVAKYMVRETPHLLDRIIDNSNSKGVR